MISQMQEFVSDTSSTLVDKVQKLRKESVESVREAAVGSAEKIKSLKGPVRTFARSGVKLTTVSQATFASLIDLRADALTSALSELALRLEKAARAESIVELVRDQVDMFPATRARKSENRQRAVEIFKHAGRDLKNVATRTYERVVETAEEKIPEVKTARRKAKSAVRKTKARAKKVVAAAA